ncbi:MAG: hypothetical protein SCALA702_15660 [Melioribacteraceae bacterium]|nr:MAG: hypothetical protein SCALA702_15660 [Melioribacteraceae bacterium]
MHSIISSVLLLLEQKQEEPIDTKSTLSKSFARCNNSKCGSIYLFEPREFMGETGMLCPTCRDKIATHHVVQCSCCQSIVNFIEAEPSEEPVMFHVEKCSHCHGTRDDEKEVKAYYYPDAFV